jgi:oryzin
MASFRSIAVFLGALLPAVLAAPARRAPEAIPGKYIITLKDDVAADAHLSWVSDVHTRSLSKRDTTGVEETYDIGKWHAYAGEFDEATIEEIKSSPEVRNSSAPDLYKTQSSAKAL